MSGFRGSNRKDEIGLPRLTQTQPFFLSSPAGLHPSFPIPICLCPGRGFYNGINVLPFDAVVGLLFRLINGGCRPPHFFARWEMVDKDEIVRGGQGRSADEVVNEAWSFGLALLVALLGAAVFLAIVIANPAK
jgi:hypothetical protein